MTMYAKAVGATITVGESGVENDPGFTLTNQVEVLPLWVAQSAAFQRLWATNRVQVATDAGMTQIITSIPAAELGGTVTSAAISDATATGVALLTAPSAASALSTLGGAAVPSAGLVKSTGTALTTAVVGSDYLQTVSSTSLTDATTTGKNLITAANAAAAATAVGATASPTASVPAQWDANKNLSCVNVFEGFATTVTSGTAVTMTVSSPQITVYTGSTAQTVKLPTTGVPAGADWMIINQSTAAVTVQSSAAATVCIIAPTSGSNPAPSAWFTAVVATPTTAANWNAQHLGVAVASGKILTVNNSISLTGTDGTVMTFPTTTATIARTDAAQTFTGIQTMTTPVVNGLATGTGVAATATASTLATRDANKNLTAGGFIPSATSTATAAGTTTLTIASTQIQIFTGTTTQTVVLPTTSVVAGQAYTVINTSTGIVTVQASGLATITTVAAGATLTFIAVAAAPTTAAGWSYH